MAKTKLYVKKKLVFKQNQENLLYLVQVWKAIQPHPIFMPPLPPPPVLRADRYHNLMSPLDPKFSPRYLSGTFLVNA